MADRFRHAIEHQPDAHSGGEQHREPAGIGIVRRGVLTAQTDFTQRRHDQVKTQKDEDIGGPDEEPRQVAGQGVPQRTEPRLRFVLKRQGQDHKGHDRQPRDQKDGVVDIEPERPDGAFDIVLTDLVFGLDHIRSTLRLRKVVGRCHIIPLIETIRGRSEDTPPLFGRFADHRITNTEILASDATVPAFDAKK